MNESNPAENPLANASREEIISALFANMVMQQTNMALMFLGRVPHPETGQQVLDLETARMFIDQLEMLETKTRGNLDKREEGLLKQSLTAVRMAFVEAVGQQPAEAGGQKPSSRVEDHRSPVSETVPGGSGSPGPIAETGASTDESESRKKFTKKY